MDWYDASDSYSTTSDFTPDVKALPLFTDTGTGEVNEAKIVLRCLDGKHIVSGDKVKQFDRFRIRCTDLGSNTYDKFFEVINIIPSQAKSEGTLLTIECLGIEWHTQHIHMARPYYFEDAHTVADDISKFYNTNKGTDQPQLNNFDIVHDGTKGNGLPFYTANNYEYGLVEDSCYNRWMDVIEKLGNSVSTGGTLSFYEFSFNSTGVNAMDFNVRPSGDNTTTVQILNAKVTNPKTVGEQEGIIANPTGTNVMAWGSNEHGTLPTEFSKYDSNLMFFNFRPEWITGVLFAVDALVKVTTSNIAKHYKCLVEHTSGTFATDLTASKWTLTDMKTIFGDSLQYSPWTDGKKNVIGNCGANPDRTVLSTGGWFDINCVINDTSGYFRTWVDARASTNAQLDALADDGANDDGYSYDLTRARFPNGFRVLVHQDASGDLAGLDDMVAEFRKTAPTSYSWFPLYRFDLGTIPDSAPKVAVLVIDEGKIYEGAAFDGNPTWTAKDGADFGNDCVHPYTTAPAEDDGVDNVLLDGVLVQRADVTDNTNRPDITHSGTAWTQNKKSAIKFVAVSSSITQAAFTWAGATDTYYNNTIGFNIRFPFPNCTFNGISETVGSLYGGGLHTTWGTSTAYVRGNIVINSNTWYECIIAHTSGTFSTDLTANKWIAYFPEPSVLDIQNMNYNRNGTKGFNHGADSEDLGQISAVAMWLKYSQVLVSNSEELDDEHPFRAFFVDTKDNIVYQDFVISFSNNWEDIRLPISGFRIYRGYKPLYGWDAPIAAFFPPKELEVLNVFEWRNVKIFGVQYQAQYDKHGRYNPANATVNTNTPSVVWANLAGVTRTLWLDGFRFIKPLLTTSGEQTDRNLEPDFIQRPNITLYHQLRNDAKSQLEIEKFQHKEFNIETSGDDIFDLPFGDSFYLKNDQIIDDDDKAGENNNIKLVAKRIEYSITKPPMGKGGLRRKIQGSKIFT